MSFERERRLLPEYPSIPHLPFQPNTGRGDTVATEAEADILFSAFHLVVEEKLDGAYVGITSDADRQPLVRSRDHILRKGYLAKTPAKKQFASLFNYAHQVMPQILRLQTAARAPVAIAGQWMVMTHGTRYDNKRTKKQPFVAFELYDPEINRWLDPERGRDLLQYAGFALPDLLPRPCSYEHLAAMAQGITSWSSPDLPEKREGVVVKVGDGEYLTHRFKMVRPGFVPGLYFDKK